MNNSDQYLYNRHIKLNQSIHRNSPISIFREKYSTSQQANMVSIKPSSNIMPIEYNKPCTIWTPQPLKTHYYYDFSLIRNIKIRCKICQTTKTHNMEALLLSHDDMIDILENKAHLEYTRAYDGFENYTHVVFIKHQGQLFEVFKKNKESIITHHNKLGPVYNLIFEKTFKAGDDIRQLLKSL